MTPLHLDLPLSIRRSENKRKIVTNLEKWEHLCPIDAFLVVIIMPPFEEVGVYCFAHVGQIVLPSVGLSIRRQT